VPIAVAVAMMGVAVVWRGQGASLPFTVGADESRG
jgi:hypothetical protein